MKRPRLSPGQILLRIAAGAALVTGCCFQSSSGCMVPEGGYQRDFEGSSGDFDIDIDWEGGCLPDIEPEVPVQRIAITKLKESADDPIVASAFCSAEGDRIEMFVYRGKGGCELWIVGEDDGGANDGGVEDGGVEDGGVADGGTSADLCHCSVGEPWSVGFGHETAFCEGEFLIVAETIDGATATLEYEQEFDDPEEDQVEDDDSGGCCCRAVGS